VWSGRSSSDRRSGRACAPLLVLILVLTACSVGGQTASTVADTSTTVDLQNIPPEERQFVEDGVVTKSEYRAAMQNAVACAEERGWSASIEEAPNGELQLGITTDGLPTAEEDERMDADSFYCLATYSDAVTQVYLHSNAPTGAQRDQELRDVVQCLNGVGVTASVDMTESEFLNAIDSALSADERPQGYACIDSHSDLFR
jgi:hypothetical protein